MIEYIIYAIVAFIVIHFIVNVVDAVQQDNEEGDQPPLRQMANVRVRMEEHNNCWYGYYHQKNGGEIFVAQGNTFEEAVKNCTERLNSKDAPYQFKLHFDKS